MNDLPAACVAAFKTIAAGRHGQPLPAAAFGALDIHLKECRECSRTAALVEVACPCPVCAPLAPPVSWGLIAAPDESACALARRYVVRACLDGRLEHDERAWLTLHLDRCLLCRESVAGLRPSLQSAIESVIFRSSRAAAPGAQHE